MVALMIDANAGRIRGFTLIELMITVTIVGVLAMLAAPSLHRMMLAQQVRSATSDLQTTLYFARSEAIKRAANVDTVPTSSDWKNGWTVQVSGGGSQSVASLWRTMLVTASRSTQPSRASVCGTSGGPDWRTTGSTRAADSAERARSSSVARLLPGGGASTVSATPDPRAE